MHFAIAVVHNEDEDINEILAPFDQQSIEPEHVEFQIEVKKGEEEGYKKDRLDNKDGYWGKPENYAKKLYYDKLTPVEFVKEYGGYEQDEFGNWGYTSNPNGYWDWYVIGGRWKNMLKLTEGANEFMEGEASPLDKGFIPREGFCDSAKIKDIDFEGILAQEIKDAEERWEKAQVFKKEELAKGRDLKGIENDMRFQFLGHWGSNKSKEEYVNAQGRTFGVYGYVINGEWIDKDTIDSTSMSWDMPTERQREIWDARDKAWPIESAKILASIRKERPDAVLTIVDIHR